MHQIRPNTSQRGFRSTRNNNYSRRNVGQNKPQLFNVSGVMFQVTCVLNPTIIWTPSLEKFVRLTAIQIAEFLNNKNTCARNRLLNAGDLKMNQVLLLPPNNSFYRRLIHQIVEVINEKKIGCKLVTFSFGMNDFRRTAVFYCTNKNLRSKSFRTSYNNTNSQLQPSDYEFLRMDRNICNFNTQIHEFEMAEIAEYELEEQNKLKKQEENEKLMLQSNSLKAKDLAENSETENTCFSTEDDEDHFACCNISNEKKEGSRMDLLFSLIDNPEYFPEGAEVYKEQLEEIKLMNARKNNTMQNIDYNKERAAEPEVPLIPIYTDNSLFKLRPVKENSSRRHCGETVVSDSWDDVYDDNGDFKYSQGIDDLTQSISKLTTKESEKKYNEENDLKKSSYSKDEKFAHVLEISNFPPEFKEQDLFMVFSQFKESGFSIKWVDDTHALVIFSSADIASKALHAKYSFVSVKRISEASLQSQQKVNKFSTFMLPYKQRPQTCSAMAKRMVSNALGVRLESTRAEREIEKRILQEAKERKILNQKQRAEAWGTEDDVKKKYENYP